MIDDPAGTTFSPQAAVYNPAGGSVYVYLTGGTNCGSSGGRIDRIIGTKVTGQATACQMSNAIGNSSRKIASLNNFNRIFGAQQKVPPRRVGSGWPTAPRC